MNRDRRTTRALKTAVTIAGATMALGVVVAVGHWRQLIEDPIGLSVGVVGLALVVFLTYLVFGLAGYDVRTDGTATVPGGIAWLVAALAAILLVIGVFALSTLR